MRTAYESAEGAERERFSLFSAAVRESHDKERTRAERTKNWSIVGSVLGALIGVMGSTYINRVRLQELRGLLLEAQKGPVSLQEALRVQAGMHRSQQEELQGLIHTLSSALRDRSSEEGRTAPPAPAPAPIPQRPAPVPAPSASEAALRELLLGTQRAQTLMEGLQPQLSHLEQSVANVESQLQAVSASVHSHFVADKVVVSAPDTPVMVCDTEDVMQGLAQTEKRLGDQISKTTLYSTILTYSAFAVTVPLLYIIFRGS